jgi:N-acetylmuramoyl-L-alanine amidase
MFIQQFKDDWPGWKVRPGKHGPGDPGKEALFYILVNTKCSWILPEWGFFDNYHDWAIIREEAMQLQYANTILNFAKRVSMKRL